MKLIILLLVTMWSVLSWVLAVYYWFQHNDHTALAWLASSVLCANYLTGQLFKVKERF